MIVIPSRFNFERDADCSAAVPKNLMVTNSITVQLFFEYNAISLFSVDDELLNMFNVVECIIRLLFVCSSISNVMLNILALFEEI